MSVRVKICGITNLEDAVAALEFGADALGFVFFAGSPRYITLESAEAIVRRLPPFISKVGVFVDENPEEIEKIVRFCGIDIIQLHGNEAPQSCNFQKQVIKAIRVKSLDSLDPLIHYKEKVCAFLLDTFTPDSFGGSGRIFNWDVASYAKQYGRIVLSGGLTPENVFDAVQRVKPYGVDVCSGVELEKGKKDHNKLRTFIEKAKAA